MLKLVSESAVIGAFALPSRVSVNPVLERDLDLLGRSASGKRAQISPYVLAEDLGRCLHSVLRIVGERAHQMVAIFFVLRGDTDLLEYVCACA